MKRIWAPWRSVYIGAERPAGCLLCEAPGKGLEAGFYVLSTGPLSTVMLNRYPYTSGHLMVSPIRHVARLEELSDEESSDIFKLLRRSTAAIESALKPQGFNIGMNLGTAAGAGIGGHIHMHVVPRWNGDTNFMPVLADTMVVPVHLEEIYRKLKPFFEGA